MAKSETTDPQDTSNVAPEKVPSIRERILAKAAQKEVLELTWAGVTFEWRRPTLETISRTRDAQTDDADRNFVVQMVVDHSYVPGTDELVFQPEDYAELMNLPFDGEYQEIVSKINGQLDLKVDNKVKN